MIELGGGFQSLISLGFFLCIKKIGFFVINILCYVCLIFSGIVMDKMGLFILSRGDMILFLSDFLISFSTERGTKGFPKFWILYSKWVKEEKRLENYSKDADSISFSLLILYIYIFPLVRCIKGLPFFYSSVCTFKSCGLSFVFKVVIFAYVLFPYSLSWYLNIFVYFTPL